MIASPLDGFRHDAQARCSAFSSRIHPRILGGCVEATREIRALGLPRTVMMISSPRAARETSAPNFAFACSSVFTTQSHYRRRSCTSSTGKSVDDLKKGKGSWLQEVGAVPSPFRGGHRVSEGRRRVLQATDSH